MSTPHEPRIPNLAGDDDDGDDQDRTKVNDLSGVGEVAGAGHRDYPCLVIVAGTGVGETYRLEVDDAVVGRGESAQFRIVDDGISRAHVRLSRQGNSLFAEDLKSANGTFVNGERITRSALRDGDKISVGSTTILKFTYHDKIDEAFQQRMYEAALRDGLTKAYNKRYLLDRLATELAFARRHSRPLTLLMMDIDHFKSVNDTHGHPAGDAVLVKVAATVQGGLRAEDVFARYGGEEFAVICRDTNLASAAVLGERIRQRVEGAPIDWEAKRIPITVSVGIASSGPASARSVEQLIARADEALYDAKRSGRNRVCAKADE